VRQFYGINVFLQNGRELSLSYPSSFQVNTMRAYGRFFDEMADSAAFH
jgi:hypothetical protein